MDNSVVGGSIEVSGAYGAMWFEAPQLRSKSNFRRSGNGTKWNQIRSFEDDVAIRARSVRPADWMMGDANAELKDRPVVVAALFADTLIDTGNATKSLFDALEGVLYCNDASIRAEIVVTRRVRQGPSYLAFATCGESSQRDLILLCSELAAVTLSEIEKISGGA
jgi:Holliday junction resolvase RusA-like endonuclease